MRLAMATLPGFWGPNRFNRLGCSRDCPTWRGLTRMHLSAGGIPPTWLHWSAPTEAGTVALKCRRPKGQQPKLYWVPSPTHARSQRNKHWKIPRGEDRAPLWGRLIAFRATITPWPSHRPGERRFCQSRNWWPPPDPDRPPCSKSQKTRSWRGEEYCCLQGS